MREDTGIIKAGMAIVISSGCYSDYSFGQVYIALKDFNSRTEKFTSGITISSMTRNGLKNGKRSVDYENI